MFFSLILFFLLNGTSWGQTQQEVSAFSKTSQWLKILYYQNNKSLVKSSKYFLDPNGHKDPELELSATIKAFQEDYKNEESVLLQCVFVARAKILLEKWPGLFKLKNCSDFQTWKKGLDAGDLYLVYASAYPNNPASMFGHTFLRFDRKSKGSSKSSQAILGYSLAYQAQTDPNDNPLEYTFKGVFGGYPAFLEVKPHYINLGVYNNLESRDLWEYPIELTLKQKELFIRHAWELSLTVYYDYYFFDENCSTFLLRMLEVINPKVDFQTKDTLFVVPQETLKEVVEQFEIKYRAFIPSIERKLKQQYKSLSIEERRSFKKGKSNLNGLKNINKNEVLDLLIDYWKFQNYKAKTQLEEDQKKIMYQTLLQRSQNSQPTKFEFKNDYFLGNKPPHKGHDLQRLKLLVGNEQIIEYRYGFHDYFDNPSGMDDSSHINFFDISYDFEAKGANLKMIDILSIQNFQINFPRLSWRGSAGYSSTNFIFKEKFSYLNMQAGLAWQKRMNSLFGLVGFKSILMNEGSKVIPIINIGFKYFFINNFGLIADYEMGHLQDPIFSNKTNYISNGQIELKRFHSAYSYGLFYKDFTYNKRFGLSFEKYF